MTHWIETKFVSALADTYVYIYVYGDKIIEMPLLCSYMWLDLGKPFQITHL